MAPTVPVEYGGTKFPKTALDSHTAIPAAGNDTA